MIAEIDQKIAYLSDQLISRFDRQHNCWVGRQWMSPAVTAEFLILCKYIDQQDPVLIRGAIEEIRTGQNEDGGFPAYFKGPSELSLSCICHLALSLYEDQASPGIVRKCTKYISENGGLEKAMLLPKFYHFLFGKYPVRKLPEIRPGLNIVPKWSGFSVYDMASWVRSWIVPISILWHQEKYRNYSFPIRFYIPGLRKYSLKKAENWILKHQEKDGSWYGVFHSTMMSILALYSLGYTKQHPVIKRAFNFILSLQEISSSTLRQQPFLGPVWDTALALIALRQRPELLRTDIRDRAESFLLNRQSKERGDWHQHNKSDPGGWGFEFQNEFYPDVDTTSIVLQALNTQIEKREYRSATNIGLKWLLSMQNNDGSWSAFDRNNNHLIIEWYLNFRNYNIGIGPGLALDRGSPDLTAHALEAIAGFGFDRNSTEVKKAIKWLKQKQMEDGSWFGRWGLCYLYGTGAVLEALHSVGENMKLPYIQNAVRFICRHQNPDGGWGECPEAYYDKKKKGKGPSTLTQTSWAVRGLIKAGENTSPQVEKGIAYLFDKLDIPGSLDENHYQAVAAPPLYQRYELYPYYFPLMALKAYRPGRE